MGSALHVVRKLGKTATEKDHIVRHQVELQEHLTHTHQVARENIEQAQDRKKDPLLPEGLQTTLQCG